MTQNPSSSDIRDLSVKYLLDVYPRKLMDIVMHSGKGAYVTDLDGKQYLDFAGANGVNILGYTHPAVLSAAQDQIAQIIQSGNYFYNAPQALLAEKLCTLSKLDKVFFSNSGAESVEAAIKIARRFGSKVKKGASTLICFKSAWHGRTIGTISATGSEKMQQGFGPLLPGFTIVPDWDLDAIKNACDDSVVGVMCEPVIGHGGLLPAPAGFLKELRALCDSKNLLLILDEVQTGLGRTGTFFNFEQHGIQPDILCLAKGLGSGFPIGATLASDACAQYMDVGSHGSATGGNPLCTAVALRVVETISEPAFLEEIRKKSIFLSGQLQQLKDRIPESVSGVRSAGLLAAIDIETNTEEALKVFARNGLLVTRVSDRCIRMLPPLTISEGEILEGVGVIRNSFPS